MTAYSQALEVTLRADQYGRHPRAAAQGTTHPAFPCSLQRETWGLEVSEASASATRVTLEPIHPALTADQQAPSRSGGRECCCDAQGGSPTGQCSRGEARMPLPGSLMEARALLARLRQPGGHKRFGRFGGQRRSTSEGCKADSRTRHSVPGIVSWIHGEPLKPTSHAIAGES